MWPRQFKRSHPTLPVQRLAIANISNIAINGVVRKVKETFFGSKIDRRHSVSPRRHCEPRSQPMQCQPPDAGYYELAIGPALNGIRCFPQFIENLHQTAMIINADRCELPAVPVQQGNAQALFQPPYVTADYGVAHAKGLRCAPDTAQSAHCLKGFESGERRQW